eukprot:COSAG06_NODE_79_length_25437_cov_12.062673_9_plen_88_part_00
MKSSVLRCALSAARTIDSAAVYLQCRQALLSAPGLFSHCRSRYVCNGCRYFASRASAFTTGSVLRVDGGSGIGGRDPASAKSVRARM